MERSRTGRLLSALFSLLVLNACGGDTPDDGHSGPPGSAACVPGELALPHGRCQPAGLPPDMVCPPGERPLAGGGCQPAGVPAEACAAGRFVPDDRGGCEPILPEEACPLGQMAVPGERACREVLPCGEEPWNAAMPVEATTEYVDQAYPRSDSDGSRDRPWKTVQEGVVAASPGAIVAVAEGSYTEDVLVEGKPVRLWGRCPARTVVVGVGAQPAALLISGEGASGSEVRGLAVTGSRMGIVVQSARSVALEEVWVHEAGSVGVAMWDLAGAMLRGALVEQNHDIGVFVEGSEATVEATVVRATQPNGAGRYGRGITVQQDPETGERGTLSLAASLIEQNHEAGVEVVGSEATVEATVVRATQSNDEGKLGEGIYLWSYPETGERGTLSLAASLVEQNYAAGVAVLGSEAIVEATVVRATQPNGEGQFGRGISVQPGYETGERGTLSLAASLVEQNYEVGVFVAGSEATIAATVVRATQPNGAGKFGRGIGVESNLDTGERGTLSLAASLIEQNHDVGVFVGASEATIAATVVRATKRAPADQKFGDGILVLDGGDQRGTTITVTESTDNARAGVLFVGSTGDLSFVRSSDNRFGLVLQGEVQPTLGEGNSFAGNLEQGKLIDGDLAIPGPAPAPPPPAR